MLIFIVALTTIVSVLAKLAYSSKSFSLRDNIFKDNGLSQNYYIIFFFSQSLTVVFLSLPK